MKLVLTILAFNAIFCSCNSQAQSGQRAQIAELVTALLRKDTNSIFRLIDTNALFQVQDEEYLWQLEASLQKKSYKCELSILDNAIKARNTDIGGLEYTLSFCRGSKGEVNADSFDLIVTFLSSNKNARIAFLEIVNQINLLEPIKVPR